MTRCFSKPKKASTRRPGSGWGIATLDSYGPGRDLSLIPDAHIGFLERCREFYETDTHIFVHASYDPELRMDQQPSEMLRWESLRNRIPEPHASGKHVIAGHTSQKNGEILNLEHLTCIDTFCYGGGWLTAIDVHTREVWQANQDGIMRHG
jgi:serine/threonine protein phosphatase 1